MATKSSSSHKNPIQIIKPKEYPVRRLLAGFSLTELLLYTAMLFIVAGAFIGILSNLTVNQGAQNAEAEVSSQLNYALGNISLMVKESSLIDIASSTPADKLVLKMKDPCKDKVEIYKNAQDKIQVDIFSHTDPVSGCATDESKTYNLTTGKVKVNNLQFILTSNYPAHDQVAVDISMTDNLKPSMGITKQLSSVVSRVSAATFDSDLIPGGEGSTDMRIGVTSLPWKDLFIQNGINDSLFFSSTSNSSVGIGTQTPQSKLEVIGNIAAKDSDADFVQLWANGTINSGRGGSKAGLGFGFSDNQTGAGWSEKMTIGEGGAVGIGMLNPDSISSPNHVTKLVLANDDNKHTLLGIWAPTGKNAVTAYWANGDTGADDRWTVGARYNIAGTSFGVWHDAANDYRLYIENDGDVGIGTMTPGSYKLYVNGFAYAAGGWHSSGADYAEWFEKEEDTLPGDLIGINLDTGKARKYRNGDAFIGIHSKNPGIVGGREKETDEEMQVTHVVVGLMGQLEFDNNQTVVENRIVKTNDGKQIGILLNNGKVLLGGK